MATRDLTIRLKATGNAVAKLGQMRTRVGGINAGMVSLVGTATLVGGAILKFAKDGIEAYTEFESAIAEIGARTSLTEAQLEQVADAAKEMGKQSKFSATDAANAMLQLITSGSDAAEAMALLPDVMNLAAASGLSLETSADAVTDVMKQFGLGVGEATRVVDTLVAGSQSSSATVGDLIAAMANGGTAAAAYGLSLEDTVAMLALVAENGIKGAEAGTQVRSMLVNMTRGTEEAEEGLKSVNHALQAIEAGYSNLDEAIADGFEFAEDENFSIFDAEGVARDAEEWTQEISTAFDAMDDELRSRTSKQLFGSYGQLGGIAIANADGIDEMTGSMNEQNTAAEVAGQQLESFENRVEMLNGSIETLMIEVMGPFVENVLKPSVDVITQIVNGLINFVSGTNDSSSALSFLSGMFSAFGTIAETTVGLIVALMQGDFAAAWEYAKALVEQVFLTIDATVSLQLGLLLITFADFMGGLVQLAADGLNQVVIFFQNAFHGIRVFVHGVVISLLSMVQDLLNGVLQAIDDALRPILEGIVNNALVPGFIKDGVSSLLNALGTRIDLTGQIQALAAYEAPGLGDFEGIGERVAAGVRAAGESLVDRSSENLARVAELRVANVHVEIGTNVGDDVALVRTIRDAARRGEIY